MLRSFPAAVVAALALSMPAVAAAAPPPLQPQIVRVAPATGKQAVVAGSPAVSRPGALAVGDGTLYIPQAVDGDPVAGVYALPAAGGTATALATGLPTTDPAATLLAGGALYSFDQAGVVVGVDRQTGAQSVVANTGPIMSFPPQFATAAGGTAYMTASETCYSADYYANVLSLDLATGTQRIVAALPPCYGLGGIAVDGNTLYVAVRTSNTQGRGTPSIISVDATTGATRTIAAGHPLSAPQGVLLDGRTLRVADGRRILNVNVDTGKVTTLSRGGALGGAYGLAQDGHGAPIYVSEYGEGVRDTITAPKYERPLRTKLSFTLGCDVACALDAGVYVYIGGKPVIYLEPAGLQPPVIDEPTRYAIALTKAQKRTIGTAFLHGRSVRLVVTNRPVDVETGIQGVGVRHSVKLIP